jgi:multidrug resistance protein, MATE family
MGSNEYIKDDSSIAVFDGYVESTLDPGQWLLLFTIIFCVFLMVIIVPFAAWYTWKRRQIIIRQSWNTATPTFPTEKNELLVGPERETIPLNLSNVICGQRHESVQILQLTIPYTVASLTSSIFSNVCLILVSQQIGTRSVAAYALVQILVGLSDGILMGPISACTTLCSQACGSGNTLMAGQYIQLSVLLYCLGSIPFTVIWWLFMYDIILYLEWGDHQIAMYSQEFVRVYVWSTLLKGFSSAIWELLEVSGHSYEGAAINIMWGSSDVIGIALLVYLRSTSVADIGYLYIATSIFYIALTLCMATCKGWFKTFWKGLIGDLAIRNKMVMRNMFKQAIPLCWGSFLSNAEWAVFTFFASFLGPAEVAAWALMGSIWEIFYSITSGIGDAAEIRVAFHLGDNHPSMARLSAFKSLFIGMMMAALVSILYFSLQRFIPVWFTSDETLQAMLLELVPFVGIANLTMTFGMQCWSIIGAQGKYKLATWISFISSWGISVPLAAISVFVFRLDLQGLAGAIVIGYVVTGSVLSYYLISTDWNMVASKIRQQHLFEDMSELTPEDAEDKLYAQIKAAKGTTILKRVGCNHALNNIRMITLPAGLKPGLIVGCLESRSGTYILTVFPWSHLNGIVKPGDAIISIDFVDLSNESPDIVANHLSLPSIFDRHLVIELGFMDEEDLNNLKPSDLNVTCHDADIELVSPPANSYFGCDFKNDNFPTCSDMNNNIKHESRIATSSLNNESLMERAEKFLPQENKLFTEEHEQSVHDTPTTDLYKTVNKDPFQELTQILMRDEIKKDSRLAALNILGVSEQKPDSSQEDIQSKSDAENQDCGLVDVTTDAAREEKSLNDSATNDASNPSALLHDMADEQVVESSVSTPTIEQPDTIIHDTDHVDSVSPYLSDNDTDHVNPPPTSSIESFKLANKYTKDFSTLERIDESTEASI